MILFGVPDGFSNGINQMEFSIPRSWSFTVILLSPSLFFNALSLSQLLLLLLTPWKATMAPNSSNSRQTALPRSRQLCRLPIVPARHLNTPILPSHHRAQSRQMCGDIRCCLHHHHDRNNTKQETAPIQQQIIYETPR